ncbi:hypothetical protein K492DRAFT_132731, partial [Lichtheimia hyalospora FSU 10163]
GDTMSFHCIEAKLPFRLDINILLDSEKEPIEATRAEAASQSRRTSLKLYHDKLKSILASKCNLISLLKKLDAVDQDPLELIYTPILQIMGLKCTSLSLIDEKLYLLHKLKSFQFPRTYQAVSKDDISKTFEGLERLEHMLSNISDNVAQHTRDTLSRMDTITSGLKTPKASFDIDKWIADAFWETRSIAGANGDEETLRKLAPTKVCK